MSYSWHTEPHFIARNNWLRAAVLGANDGLISTSSLLMGMASAEATQSTLLIAGVAALVAGAVSMAAGEYVSVSSQADIERADLKIERKLLDKHPEEELEELTQIYIERGLNHTLASEVAAKLMAHDDLDAHARDELGITETSRVKPFQAAGASALSFVFGAMVPVVVVLLSPPQWLTYAIVPSSLIGLAMLGYISAKLGGAAPLSAILRVLTWGIVALVTTYLIGGLFGVQAAAL